MNYHSILLLFKEKVTGKTWVHGFFKATDAGLYKFKKEEENPNLEISVFILSHFERPDQPVYVPLTSKAQFDALKAEINSDYGIIADQQRTVKLSVTWGDLQ